MDKYSPFYYDPKYEPDITKLSDQALEERLIFLRILTADYRMTADSILYLERYKQKYQKEWERRRLETNHNNN